MKTRGRKGGITRTPIPTGAVRAPALLPVPQSRSRSRSRSRSPHRKTEWANRKIVIKEIKQEEKKQEEKITEKAESPALSVTCSPAFTASPPRPSGKQLSMLLQTMPSPVPSRASSQKFLRVRGRARSGGRVCPARDTSVIPIKTAHPTPHHSAAKRTPTIQQMSNQPRNILRRHRTGKYWHRCSRGRRSATFTEGGSSVRRTSQRRSQFSCRPPGDMSVNCNVGLQK